MDLNCQINKVILFSIFLVYIYLYVISPLFLFLLFNIIFYFKPINLLISIFIIFLRILIIYALKIHHHLFIQNKIVNIFIKN